MGKELVRLLPQKDDATHFLCPQYERDLCKLDEEIMPYSWSFSSWDGAFKSTQSYLYVLIDKDTLIGFSLFQESNGHIHLLKIAILQEFEGNGLGKKILEGSLDDLKEAGFSDVFLEVSTSNTRAIKFYERFGFIKYHTAKNYYSDGYDALKMSLSLLL